jgi:hypothetical protein
MQVIYQVAHKYLGVFLIVYTYRRESSADGKIVGVGLGNIGLQGALHSCASVGIHVGQRKLQHSISPESSSSDCGRCDSYKRDVNKN